jgi:hypothetical protein
MTLSSNDWNRIERFVGYGREDAPVVFVGIEEGLSSESNLGRDLVRRSKFESIMDLQLAHKGIEGTERFFNSSRPQCQRTWRPMCHLMLRRRDLTAKPTRELRSAYQAAELGRENGDTLLTELLPYPHRTTGDWLYKELRRYQIRKEYEADMLPTRLELLSRVLAKWPRELIVCYGKGNWHRFKCLIHKTFCAPSVEWASHQKASCVSAVVNGTRVVLTTHFSSKEFNSEDQLATFAAVAIGRARRT